MYETDDDLVLVGDALPFGLKLTESLLAQSPNHRGLLLTACSRVRPLLIRIRGLRRIGRGRRGSRPRSGAPSTSAPPVPAGSPVRHPGHRALAIPASAQLW